MKIKQITVKKIKCRKNNMMTKKQINILPNYHLMKNNVQHNKLCPYFFSREKKSARTTLLLCNLFRTQEIDLELLPPFIPFCIFNILFYIKLSLTQFFYLLFLCEIFQKNIFYPLFLLNVHITHMLLLRLLLPPFHQQKVILGKEENTFYPQHEINNQPLFFCGLLGRKL